MLTLAARRPRELGRELHWLKRAPWRLGATMTRFYTARVRDRRTGTEHVVSLPADRYILESLEEQGIELPFLCRNGACTSCAVRRNAGQIEHPDGMGLSSQLQQHGYSLICVGYARSDIDIETQDEDEVYDLQFGRYFGQGKVRFAIPLDDE